MQAETLGTFQVVMPKLLPAYNDVYYEFNENILDRQYKKWNKYNTGSYVYILDGNSTSYQLYKLKNKLVFINNNSLELSVDVDSMRKKYYTISRPKGIKMRCGTPRLARKLFNESLALEYRFPIKRDLGKSTLCKKIKLVHEFDVKYGYINFEKEQCIEKPNFNIRVSYAYGFLLLPNDVKYTDEVIEKILHKYKQAWECTKEKLQHKTAKNDSNLTLLEKAVGKEKLECLDKYLVWDANESK